ncbi:hypothetical protein DL770_003677 [Monosporascus sp. CRB-9-2]|nr:hypothetical protein DL770_003677 [Monosporascus sp. CRB-9-2]
MTTDSPPMYTDTPLPVLPTPHFEAGETDPFPIEASHMYNAAERPTDILGIAEAAGRKQVNLSFVLNILPLFLLNMDTADFEQGMWHEVFPPFKRAAEWVLTKAVPAWHPGRWRFAACSTEGKAKRLAV